MQESSWSRRGPPLTTPRFARSHKRAYARVQAGAFVPASRYNAGIASALKSRCDRDQMLGLRHVIDVQRTMRKADHAVHVDDKHTAELAHVLIAADRRAVNHRGLHRMLELRQTPAPEIYTQETVGGVGQTTRIGQHRKGQLELRPKLFGFRRRALADRDDPEIRGLEVLPLVAQLHELLAAVWSSIVPHKH